MVLDGPDGGGKSTQAPRLVEHLRTSGFPACRHLREPGATPVGEKIRSILLDASLGEMEPATEVFLYLAARAELIGKEIAPALERGEAVVCERFLLSTVVYQGAALGMDAQWIGRCFEPVIHGLEPDVTIVLDLPPETGLKRRGEQRDRLERRDLDFHRRVRQGFLDAARRDSVRVRIVDATAPEAAVAAAIRKEVDDVLRSRRRPR